MKQPHQHQAHQHVTPENFRAPFSLLALSAKQRLGGVLLVLVVLWSLVYWALQELA